jgi:hypothetical protein
MRRIFRVLAVGAYVPIAILSDEKNWKCCQTIEIHTFQVWRVVVAYNRKRWLDALEG